MKKKKVVISLIIVVLISIILVFCLIFFKKGSNITEIPQQETPIIEVENITEIINENEEIYKEKCINNLCTQINDFRCMEGYGGIILTISNKSDEIISSRFTNIIFSTPDREIKTFIYNKELNPGESIETWISFTDLSYIEATNYRLEEPSLDELMNYYSNMAK